MPHLKYCSSRLHGREQGEGEGVYPPIPLSFLGRMVFRFKRRGGTPQFHEGKFRQKAGICPHDWLHVRVELECLSLAKCALDGWSLKAAAKSAQRLCLCETCGSQPDMKFIIFFTLVRLPTLLNSSYKFYPSPKKIYTSVTCDNFHVWSQRLTLAKYFSTSDK